ncbi:MAG TPA: hypothetical protein VIL34_02890 [Actinopolymorphaceae bacterium]|jgi:hypothetical protein
MAEAKPVGVSPSQLDKAGQDLGAVAERLSAELQSTMNELASFGDPWGGDEIGMLIGVTHQVVSELAFEKLGQLCDDLGLDSEALRSMAKAYQEAEEFASQLLEQIGKGLESIQPAV